MRHAYPADELKPLSCSPRVWNRKSRGTLDDVLGGYMLTQVDSLSALAAVGDYAEFHAAAQRVAAELSFDRAVVVSVFEASIRVLGGLLSAHLLASHPSEGPLLYPGYAGQLLLHAVDLGERLLPAFHTPTGIPHHKVHLQRGVTKRLQSETTTCTAAAGTFLVEFALLSAASGDGRFVAAAQRANDALWSRRDAHTGLVGGDINLNTGAWLTAHTGVGAGVDSFYEYLLKGWVLTGNGTLLQRWRAAELAIAGHLQHNMDVVHSALPLAAPGAPVSGWHPGDANDACVHIEASRAKGREAPYKATISALQAFWPGLAVLDGDVASARAGFRGLFSVWSQYTALPEIWDVHSRKPVSFGKDSPLRPELLESAFHLFTATGEPLYLHAVARMLQAVWSRNAVPCGFAASADVQTDKLDDRMDSYFISETLKYAFLTFESALSSGMGVQGGALGGSTAAGQWLAHRLTELHLAAVQNSSANVSASHTTAVVQVYGAWVSRFGARSQALGAAATAVLSAQYRIATGEANVSLQRSINATDALGNAAAQAWVQHLAPAQGADAVLAPASVQGALEVIAAACSGHNASHASRNTAAWAGLVCELQLPRVVFEGMPLALALALTVRAGDSIAHTHSYSPADGNPVSIRTAALAQQVHSSALTGTAVPQGGGAVRSVAPYGAALSLPAQHTLFTTEGHIIPLHPDPLHAYVAGGLASLSAVQASLPWVQRAAKVARASNVTRNGTAQATTKTNRTATKTVQASGDAPSMFTSWVQFLSATVAPLLPRAPALSSPTAAHRGTCKVIDTVTALRADALPEGVLLGSAEEAHALARHRATDEHIVMHRGLDARTLASGIQLSLAAAAPAKKATAGTPAQKGAKGPSKAEGGGDGPVEVTATHVAMLLCKDGSSALAEHTGRAFTQQSMFDAGCEWRAVAWPSHKHMPLAAPTALQLLRDSRLADMGVDGVFAFCSIASESQPCMHMPRSMGRQRLALTAAWQDGGALRGATALLEGAAFGPQLTPTGISGGVFALASPLDACNAEVGSGDDSRAFELRHVLGVTVGRSSSPPDAKGVWRRPLIAIVARGGCAFTQKARVVQAAGAAAMLLVDRPSAGGSNGGTMVGKDGDGEQGPSAPFRGASLGKSNPPLSAEEYFGGQANEKVAIPSAVVWAGTTNGSALLEYIRGAPLQKAHPPAVSEVDPQSFGAHATQVWQAVFTAGGSHTRAQRSDAAPSGFASAGHMQPTIQRVPARELQTLASFESLFEDDAARDAHHALALWPWSAQLEGRRVPTAAPDTAARHTPVAFLRDASALVAAHSSADSIPGNCTAWPLDIDHATALRRVAGVGQLASVAVWSRTREQVLRRVLEGPFDSSPPPLVELPLPPPALGEHQ